MVDMVTNRLVKNSKPKPTALIAGAVGIAVVTGVGGYVTGVFTT